MTATQAQIEAYLKLFDGDIERATATLQGVKQNRQTVAVRDYGEVIVRIEDVHKDYRVNKAPIVALGGLSLEVRAGEFIALTGPSGSGKSTALQLIGGLDRPTSGTITVNGIDIKRLSDAKLSIFRNQTIGFVFQFFYLQPFLDLQTNVEVPAMFAGTPRSERRAATSQLLEQVGLAERATHLPKELSGGQMQRAAIARALLNQPKVLLADEPTGNLDSKNGQAIIDIFEQIRDQHGTTIIMVTHDPAIAARADREIRLEDGRIA